jgi:putative Mg2+ transporter-C (MgtC) family protein
VSVDPYALDLIGRLLLAGLLGGLVGAEREYRQKAAGLRTNILIAVGSALFTVMSIELVQDRDGDPSRIAAQIVTGIGFLGGGAILRTHGNVQGLTTAATIWMNAAIGVAAGSGRWLIAVAATVTTLVVLIALQPLETYFEGREAGNRRGTAPPPPESSQDPPESFTRPDAGPSE